MPEITIDGKTKHFPYTKAGYARARRAKKSLAKKKNYSPSAIAMARSMNG